ncbi:MAG: hypothetical protein JO199_13245, partial [Candidatus Eremiobacteraeota bacterium]|nr:hypothetical protein [Candidatus Eremiobacteraeota bacterium]
QLYVGNCGTCFVYGTDSVNIYTPPFTASSSPTSTIVSGVVQPQAMVLDTNNPPNLYVANCVSCKTYAATDTVVQYANSGLGAAATLPANSLSDPVALAVDGDEDVFVANYNGNKGGGSVGVYFAPAFSGGANIVTAADTTTLVSPVALWPDGATTGSCTGLIKVPCVMMIADAGNSKVFSCGPSFTTQCGSGQTIGSGVNTPTAVAEDGSNNLYVANNGNNTLRSFAAPAFTTGTTISTKNNTPFGLAVLP